MRRSCVAVVAVGALLCALCLAGVQAKLIPGGFRQTEVNSQEVQEALQYAIAMRTSQGFLGVEKFNVCEAATQVVNGINYYLSMAQDCSSPIRDSVVVYRSFSGEYSVIQSK